MGRLLGDRHDELVAQTLVIALVMIMIRELTHRSSERRFPKEDDPVQTGFLDGSHESLRVRVEIWRARGQTNDLDVSDGERFMEGLREPRVTIMDQEACPGQKGVGDVGQVAS